MIRSTNIHSVTEFQRHTKTYIQQVMQSKNPIAITINGAAQVVVQDAATYQQMMDELEQTRFVAAIHAGERAIEAGHTQPANEAFTAIRARRGL